MTTNLEQQIKTLTNGRGDLFYNDSLLGIKSVKVTEKDMETHIKHIESLQNFDYWFPF